MDWHHPDRLDTMTPFESELGGGAQVQTVRLVAGWALSRKQDGAVADETDLVSEETDKRAKLKTQMICFPVPLYPLCSHVSHLGCFCLCSEFPSWSVALCSVFSNSPFPCCNNRPPWIPFNPCIGNSFPDVWLNPRQTNSCSILPFIWEKMGRLPNSVRQAWKPWIIVNERVSRISPNLTKKCIFFTRTCT